jgi:triacylglycerol esterase/lipase EstA (alpha/beta hydrolase family)
MARLPLILGRVVGFTAAALSAVLAVGWGYDVIRSYPNPLNLAQSDAAQILLFDTLRLVGAMWVMWSALKKGAVHLLLALLIVGVGSFIGLFSFYIMIMGVDGDFISFRNIPYLIAICELLYIAAGFLVGYALLWAGIGSRTNDDSL